mmetsp:Transcript_16645/g.54200  ORF Transcript_16645/g.54200 Transcript_16645/m.54200 type:complete len:614 (+) Transcript_16645:70-1911(+)|eukprot:CAMPEP_0118898708 /NCGR_PEP_ID=MMETSP1166-20130328/5579_1 /TAXON_ID=1104430 /ORGANISM="Chrysoreinhardia sp, Strain CCMP3193" /LENGTH=613 /DNA_ID=CAMNT_0006837819 /DNA_START=32 /DNA_END=1873 /DNA_ORIENTATION=+
MASELGLSGKEAELYELLVSLGQGHLFEGWTKDEEKRGSFFAQMELLNKSYPGGLEAYVESAKSLLAASARGDNPLEGWVPSVPEGESLEFGSPEWYDFEALGEEEAGKCAFVLVAGGLGERLGYSRIKVELPTETLTKTSYLEYYIQNILAIQQRGRRRTLPLAIMVSGDTADMTEEMLVTHKDFGAAPGQITLLKQEKVAALTDNDAKIARDGNFAVQSKPHGHGDVHVLLHQSGLVKKWASQGIEWVYFFQDTNALGFRPLYATLGVSKQRNLHCNFLAVPRLPGQAVGGIAKLEKKEDDGVSTMVINVEYNQLDPLLRATTSPEGDVAGPDSKFSPYPGNINQFVLRCGPYLKTLEKTKGVMGEFVNPKYADASKTTFKKPARLECMMQDYPKVLDPSEKVGFISVASWIAFSPCKNATADAKSKNPPACALSAEADQYFHCAEMLRTLGCDVGKSDKDETWCGISSSTLSPAVVLAPALGVALKDLKSKFPAPKFVKISKTSSLVLNGDITVRSLILDGGLVINATHNAKVILTECVVDQGGSHARVPAPDDAPEAIKIRGYDTVQADGLQVIDIKGPGTFTITTGPDGKLAVVKKDIVAAIASLFVN